ncbi:MULTISPECIES: ammonium transporter [unclassified Acinetobacter]|uniref:ammonium transporter n=1 Tax=unclassified Acinetobacter TaxID=196816 RepID=UPI002B05AE52|nr:MULTISPECIES: ammonium transporter [unclassified Acinetobacter]
MACAATAPYITNLEQINTGNTAWMLTSTALVLLMTIPGIALFYAGMVRKKNLIATALQSLVIVCLASVLWVVVGYSLAFTPNNAFIGGFDRIMLQGVVFDAIDGKISVSHMASSIPETVWIMFQMTFAIITPALITGAFAERMRFSAMFWFIFFWILLVYVPVAHWVWEPTGWLAAKGALDFAGGTVVHINAGAAGLACAYMLGQRNGYGKEPFFPNNLIYTFIGAALLWVGWFGFNAGSAGAADGRAGMAMLVTQLATAAAALTWLLVEYISRRKVTLLGACSGAVAGLVAITPASGFVDMTGALLIGLIAGVCCYWGATQLKILLKADDSLDVFGIHGVGGIVGAILTGVFAQKHISGLDASLLIQVIGAVTTFLYSAIISVVILFVINKVIGLRVDAEQEQIGLDLAQHGEHVP